MTELDPHSTLSILLSLQISLGFGSAFSTALGSTICSAFNSAFGSMSGVALSSVFDSNYCSAFSSVCGSACTACTSLLAQLQTHTHDHYFYCAAKLIVICTSAQNCTILGCYYSASASGFITSWKDVLYVKWIDVLQFGAASVKVLFFAC